MDPKPQPNHARYIQSLREMTEEERLLRAFEMTESALDTFRDNLRELFPDLSEHDFNVLYRKRLDLCHNRNW